MRSLIFAKDARILAVALPISLIKLHDRQTRLEFVERAKVLNLLTSINVETEDQECSSKQILILNPRKSYPLIKFLSTKQNLILL